MPAVNNISFDDGIYAETPHGLFKILKEDFPKTDTADELSEILSFVIQHKFEKATPFSELLTDNPIFAGGKEAEEYLSSMNGVYVRKIMGENHLIYAPFWASAHVFSLNPLKYTTYFADVSALKPANSDLSQGDRWWL
jgi:hypothetical protein